MLRLQTPLHPVPEKPPVSLGIVGECLLQGGGDVGFREIPSQLGAEFPLGGVDLPGKESAQGLGPQLPHKRFGDDVQREISCVGEQPGPKVEERAVGKAAAPP